MDGATRGGRERVRADDAAATGLPRCRYKLQGLQWSNATVYDRLEGARGGGGPAVRAELRRLSLGGQG
jgi:hypothetical protein